MKRLSKDKTLLFICDIQEKLTLNNYCYQGVIQASTMMIKSANALNIPSITTQHKAKVFGQTCKSLQKHFSDKNQLFHKTKFSMIIPQIEVLLTKNNTRNQVILMGMETHICILQTCLDLLKKKYEAYILADAVTSSRSWERSLALKRMEKQGAVITSFESATFDLLKDSTDEKFKQILKIVKQCNRQKAINHL